MILIGPSNILFGGVHVCTFQPGNFTGWGSAGVKVALIPAHLNAGVILVVVLGTVSLFLLSQSLPVPFWRLVT